MIECGRGNIDLPQDKDTPPFNVSGNFLIDGPVEYEEDIDSFDMKYISYCNIGDKSFKEFKSFLDSLDEERKTWSFDKQNYKDEKEWYNWVTEKNTHSIFLLYKNKIIGFSNGYLNTAVNSETYYEISFVIKKEYQGKGLGTQILLIVEHNIRKNPTMVEHNKDKVVGKKTILKMIAKHYSDNIASHKAFLKAGWYEAELKNEDKKVKDTQNLVFKIKKL